MTPVRDVHEWEQGWEGHQSAQRARLAGLSFTEKLQWLEEAHRLVQYLARSRSHAPTLPGEDARQV